MRVCFINENIGGHGTLHHHLRIALEDHPEVDARTVDVHPAGRLHRAFRAPIPGLAERDLDLNVLRDHVAGSVVARRRVGRLEPGTVVHLYTQSIGSTLTKMLRDHPSVVGTDATLAQSARLLPFREPTRHTDRVNEDRASDRASRPRLGHPARRPVRVGGELPARRLRHRRRSHPDRAVRHPHGRATGRGRRRPAHHHLDGPVPRAQGRGPPPADSGGSASHRTPGCA